MDNKKILELYANEPYITCEDLNKCGQCLREKIKSDVAKEILDHKYLAYDTNTLKYCEDETKRRWQQTDLYKRVRSLLDEGFKFDEIDEMMLKEGIQI